jgi:predicted PurR-regulated permease PerM
VTELGASRALYRGAFFLIVIFIAALILHELVTLIMQLFVASIIAAAMTPIVNAVAKSRLMRHSRWQPPRGLLVLLLYLVAAVIVIVLGFLVLRALVREVGTFIDSLPQYAQTLKSWLASVIAAFPGLQDVNVDLQSWITANIQVVLNGVSSALGGMLSFVGFALSLLGGFLTVLFTVFLAIYITIDAATMRDYLVVFWPFDRQQQATRLANEMGARLGHWAIGQATLMVIIGGGAWLGLQLIGVPYAVLLGIVWALAEFIPGIGPFVSAIPSILLGFTVSPAVGVAAAVFTLAWSQVENNIITPKVMGSAVELHPLVILVALIVGNTLLGPPGALLAIPVAATVAVVVDEIRRERVRSQPVETVEEPVVPEAAPVLAVDPVA